MKVNQIIPCICIDHEPNAGDSVYYGMPQLKVTGSNGNEWYEAYCPSCGRGGLFQFKSSYLALKDWNKLQKELREPLIFAPIEKEETND